MADEIAFEKYCDKDKLVFPETPLVVGNKNQEMLFTICSNGDFILRGKKIANDQEVADIICGTGKAMKGIND